YIRQIQVGCQAAFAGKPAPTGSKYIRQIQVGWQAAIAGKPAPTGSKYIRQIQVGLSGRLREQARSHRRAKAERGTPSLFTTHQAER
ncbi:hypothetical protein QF012_004287, partial [Pseudomonas laurylsulfatiphila]